MFCLPIIDGDYEIEITRSRRLQLEMGDDNSHGVMGDWWCREFARLRKDEKRCPRIKVVIVQSN